MVKKSLLCLQITLDPTDDTVVIIHTDPLPLYLKGYDVEVRWRRAVDQSSGQHKALPTPEQ